MAKGELTDAEELFDELEILSNKIKGCAMSPRSALYTSMKPEERLEFLQRHDEITKFVPLSQLDVCACIATIKKDSWSDPGCSFLIIGTEDGSVLIMDPRWDVKKFLYAFTIWKIYNFWNVDNVNCVP